MSLINQYAKTELDRDKVYIFSVVLCDNDIDRDYEKFSVSALEELAGKFLGRTGIFDHSMKAENQKSRIFSTWVEMCEGRKTADGETLCQLKAKAYMLASAENAPLIEEIEAGIKKEVSVSCSMDRATCSVCGNDKRSGKCSHISGRSYDGRLAYTVLDGAADAYEFSFVAVPAQRGAGVTKAFNQEKEVIEMSEFIEKIKECDSEITLSKSQLQSIADELERLNGEAELGRQYKKSLCDEVVALCASAMPEMDIKIFGSVAQVMTTDELQAFKKAFVKVRASKDISLQLKPAEQGTAKISQFKI